MSPKNAMNKRAETLLKLQKIELNFYFQILQLQLFQRIEKSVEKITELNKTNITDFFKKVFRGIPLLL